MNTANESGYQFPRRVRLGNRSLDVDLFGEKYRDTMIAFAQSLPERDVLFLERDIADPAEVGCWIEAVVHGAMVTLVARQDDVMVGYATFVRGKVPWTSHVAELRVVVAPPARGAGVGRLLLELVFEIAQRQGVKKVVARMTPEQVDAQRLFEQLGFEQEAILRDNAMDTQGLTHDLLLFSFRVEAHEERRCAACGVPVLTALALDGALLCIPCFDARYEEIGGGD